MLRMDPSLYFCVFRTSYGKVIRDAITRGKNKSVGFLFWCWWTLFGLLLPLLVPWALELVPRALEAPLAKRRPALTPSSFRPARADTCQHMKYIFVGFVPKVFLQLPLCLKDTCQHMMQHKFLLFCFGGFCPVTVVAERVVVPIVRATVPSAWGTKTKNACQSKRGIYVKSRSGGIYQEEREKGEDCRAHFACNWSCFRQAVQFLRGFENKDSTITSAVKS